ncbi:acyl-CoA carboxylase epsilon subunit [Streptomyces sp. NBC_00249]|uniref:acyl-CoA carboxylase epsilon subunit n=1 Tax=Streptomyces sp. NBC_00249 TaxID=2975690 RepID=UPI0022590385|nr:acyl-CoA carboxylase epsilon subunit [Streptomyces sp. NBC_00249]MCX5195253.1 acyl-CoA carboxylase epsilon subunit [Streptomyces sp. NBC_00249]
MRSDAPISSLLRVHRGTAEPEELAAVAVVVACLAGRAARDATRPARTSTAHHRPRPRPAGHGCWSGCWACR